MSLQIPSVSGALGTGVRADTVFTGVDDSNCHAGETAVVSWCILACWAGSLLLGSSTRALDSVVASGNCG